MSDDAGTVKAPGGLTPEFARELGLMEQRLDDLKADLARYADCGTFEQGLGHVAAAQRALGRMEHGLQSAHLGCCLLPGIPTPTEFGLALARLSARRTGALMIVEQKQSLDEYVARGTVLDAQLSATLLESLFYPGSMLHDGAAIVRGDRILAAGVFLPLSTERRDVARGRLLGARHRAALGLSIVSDALVLVVSEETGEVSVALGGRLHRSIPVGVLLGPPTAASHAEAPGSAPPSRRWPGARRWWKRSVRRLARR